MRYAIIEASGGRFWVEAKKITECNRLSISCGSSIIMRRIVCYRCRGSNAISNNSDMELGKTVFNESLSKSYNM